MLRQLSALGCGAPTVETASLDAQVLTALSNVIDPDFGEDIVKCGFVQKLVIDGPTGHVAFTMELTTPACPVKEMFQRQATEFVKVGIFDADVYGPSLQLMVSPESPVLEMNAETRALYPAEQVLDGDISETIQPMTISPLGNYAVQITWEDGFNQVASFEQLETLRQHAVTGSEVVVTTIGGLEAVVNFA
ncbi:MAG: hypothetical protein WDW38_002316 [Sanguina aurantia]